MNIRPEIALLILIICAGNAVLMFRSLKEGIASPNEAQAQYMPAGENTRIAVGGDTVAVDLEYPGHYYSDPGIMAYPEPYLAHVQLEYKLVGDSLFVHDKGQYASRWGGYYNADKAWRFLGLLERADTTIIRYEGEEVERYWR